jgi:hypothetical protein
MEEKEQLDFQAEKILGLDIEKSDIDVGIFGNIFMLGIETKNNKVWIDFDDENFMSLLELLKPYVLEDIRREDK